jgi:hypothetical protein
MRPLLSKTTYMYGMQCHKRFYLNRFHKNLANPEDEQSQAIFQTGTDVGLLAQNLFPGGVNAQGTEEWHSELTVKRTAELLNQVDIIYEAAFMFNGVICAVDILIRQGNTFYAFEVKATNGVKAQHTEDAALQYYVLSNNGLNLGDFSILHLNREYVRIGDLNLAELFKPTSVLSEVLEKQTFIPKNIADFKKLIYLKNIPDIEMGAHCNQPYACNFSNYCLSLIVAEEELPDEELNHEIIVDEPAWNTFKENFTYPLFFFDFETVMYGVPVFNFSRPYQNLPFQYSLHVLVNEQAQLLHHAYLGDGVQDPRPDLIMQMIRDLGTEGTILTWNMSFEKGVIAKLAIDFPEYEADLMNIYGRIVDLMNPFRPSQAVVFSEAFAGSYSIKKVLPVMVPELSYQNLQIQEGGTASFMYGQMMALGEESRAQLRKDLLAYCHLDTLAMVKIWQRVEESV